MIKRALDSLKNVNVLFVFNILMFKKRRTSLHRGLTSDAGISRIVRKLATFVLLNPLG